MPYTYTQREPFSVLGLVINVCHSSFIDLTQVCSFNVFSIFVSIFFIFCVFTESIRFYRLKSIANMSNRNDVSNKKTNRFIDVSIENVLVTASILMFFSWFFAKVHHWCAFDTEIQFNYYNSILIKLFLFNQISKKFKNQWTPYLSWINEWIHLYVPTPNGTYLKSVVPDTG